jgi:diadenosine tetraphosphate (Ap4A) HIT family hydrolase
LACELCETPGGELLWQDDFCRAVLVNDPHYPGFCRVILNRHIAEMTDLNENERQRLMKIVFVVEAAVREALRPDKINLASLGNMTPHLHWHVIPRFADDRHFPNPIWGEVKREKPANPPDISILKQKIHLLLSCSQKSAYSSETTVR